MAGHDHEAGGEAAVSDGDAGQGRGRHRGRDAGNDLEGDAGGDEGEGLFAAAAEHERIAALQSDDALATLGRPHHQAVDRLLADRGPPRTLAHGEAARPGSEVEGAGVDERVIQHEVGLAEHAGRPPRHQLGIARARPHQPHVPAHH